MSSLPFRRAIAIAAALSCYTPLAHAQAAPGIVYVVVVDAASIEEGGSQKTIGRWLQNALAPKAGMMTTEQRPSREKAGERCAQILQQTPVVHCDIVIMKQAVLNERRASVTLRFQEYDPDDDTDFEELPIPPWPCGKPKLPSSWGTCRKSGEKRLAQAFEEHLRSRHRNLMANR